ncbi:c-type cytochrome [Candidatus Palauibacter sp.]|uniref:c-type cytochrome n=1 Tax=Candidatus Palauibacter sp. TaxID=3101350 RepID=UPI003B0115D1
MCTPVRKKLLLAVLVLCFGVQTGLVYSDVRSVPLSEEALAGRELWQGYACQTCHQLYGQGGFLGPDLTHAASRVDSTRLVSLLRVGSGQMPPLGFSDEAAAAMAAFLREIDRPEIGRGQLRLGTPGEGAGAQAAFERAIEAAVASGEGGAAAEDLAEVAAGLAAFRIRPCSACHFPFRDSPVGAPDLSLVAGSLSPDSLERVLAEGRPLKGMPPPVPPLDAADRAAITAFLEFLGANREQLDAATRALAADRSLDWRALPWWEFP